MTDFVLEYNEKQGCFHHNHGNSEPETHGWVTIGKTNYDEELLFDSWLKIEIKYKVGQKIKTKKVIDLWNKFKKVSQLFNK